MKIPVFLSLLVLTSYSLCAQKVENVRAAASGEQIIITYDLTGTRPDQRFKVNLYSSHNNFAAPVLQATGDMGENVLAGKGKRIIWNAKSELSSFKGNLSFEVRADAIAAPVLTTPSNPNQFSFRDIASAKRGGNLAINWTGGTSSESVKLELMKGGVSQQALTTTSNSGKYSWSVPDDAHPGSYQVKITGASGTATSSSFAIKHKVPTALKVLPVVVIVGVIAATSGGGGGDDGGGNGSSGGSDLPEPPKPTD